MVKTDSTINPGGINLARNHALTQNEDGSEYYLLCDGIEIARWIRSEQTASSTEWFLKTFDAHRENDCPKYEEEMKKLGVRT
jgi:hypothetical protein